VNLDRFNKSQIDLREHVSPHKSCSFGKQFYKKASGNVVSEYLFDSLRSASHDSEDTHSPATAAAAGSEQHCIHIGYLSRLDADKNPGLFLQFASLLLQDHHPAVRFTVIGK
jgi:hypothetical protein